MTKSRILIVEDDREVLATIRAALGSAGYEVAEARGVLQALRKIVERPPDIVITDIVMPDGGGPSLVRFVKNVAPRARVIGLTGADLSEAYLKTFMTSGGTSVASVLRKPVRLTHLIAHLRTLLGPESKVH